MVNKLCKRQESPPWTIEPNMLNKDFHENDITEMEMSNQDINHIEEVIIGTEQGTSFPTKMGTSMCNALIDTGATKNCISEKYYQNLPLTKIHFI